MVNILLKNPTLWGTFLNQLENRTQIPWEKSPGVPPGHEITSDLFYVGGFYPGVFQVSLPYAAFTNSSDMGLHLDVEVDPSWVEHLESLSTLGREELDVRAIKNSDGSILHYLRYVDMPADDRIAFVSGFAFAHDSIEWVEHVDDLVGEIEYQTNLMKRYATAFLKEIEQAVGPSDLAKEVVDEIESEYSTPSGPTLMTPDNARKLQEEIAKSRGNKGRCMYCGAEWLIDEEEPYHNGDCTGRPSWASTLWARRYVRARKMKQIRASEEDIGRATEWATEAHEGQERKSTKEPYIVHPIGVGELLKQHGFDKDTIIAGILHDTIEDTAVTYEEIVEKFGARVADIVVEVSEDKLLPTWKERKDSYKKNLAMASIEARAVACADKIYNMQDTINEIAVKGEEAWSFFKASKEQIIAMYDGYVSIFNDLGSLFSKFSETLGALKEVSA